MASELTSAYDRMLHENEYLAPLDPDLLARLEQKVNYVQYHESSDIWAFGKLNRHHAALLYLQ